MPKQSRASGESAGRRFKRRRKRKRGKRGAVSQRRGRDKAVEGKTRQFRDRKEERPGDRKRKDFKKSDVASRSRKRRPVRRKRRQGGDRPADRDFGRDRPQRSPDKSRLGGIRDEINAIRQRREQFSERRPEQVAADRGFDPERLKGLPGAPMPPQAPQEPQPAPAPPVIGPDGRVAPQQAGGDFTQGYSPAPVQPPVTAVAPVAPQQVPQPGVFDGVDYGVDQVGGSPDSIGPAQGGAAGTPGAGVGQTMQDLGFTPADAPGPTAPPGVATDAYGKPAQPGSGPYAPQLPPYPAPQVNPRAAGMERYAQPPQPQPPRY